MIPAGFDYEVAESVEHALELLRTKEDAKLLAGGHSLLPLMKLRLARPGTLVDIGRLSDLSGVRDGGDHLAIGALTRHHDLNHDPLAEEHCPLIAYAAGLVGDPQVRHRGTIGGSLAHGDPASDLPTICLTLDAAIVARGPNGERTIDAAEFFRGFFETALGEDEIITEVRVPKVGSAGWSYIKFRQRALDWATVGVAALVGAANGSIEGARDRAHEHGPDAAAGRRPSRRRSPAPRATRSRPPPSRPTRAPTRPATPGRAPTSAATWPGC